MGVHFAVLMVIRSTKDVLIDGILQSEIMSNPELFVEPDPELPLALLDQKEVYLELVIFEQGQHYHNLIPGLEIFL